MKDTTLYDELLGLKQLWYVVGVRLDVVKQAKCFLKSGAVGQ